MTTHVTVDVDLLRSEIKKAYTEVSTHPATVIAAQMVSERGTAIGVDMTKSMLERARNSAQVMGIKVELHESLIESLPLPDASVDVLISNGVIDLVPDKDAVFAEINRVLKPGGRLQIADVVIHKEVSGDARERIDLWTG